MQVKNIVSKDPLLATLLLLSGAYFFLYYITDPARPADMFSWLGFNDAAMYPKGWFGYYDQGQYLRLAHTLADFNFSQLHQTYTYGVGYPLVAVPFIWLGFDKDPFVFFNIAVFLFATYAIYKSGRRFISPLGGFLAGFGLVFASPLLHYVDQPWNSTICLLAMSIMLLIASSRKVTRWHALAVGFMVGWVFAARYIDVIWVGLIALASLYRGSLKQLMKLVLYMAIGLILWLAPVLYSHYRIFGSPLRTPYVNHIGGVGGGSDQQASAYKLNRAPNAALGMFVGPRVAGYPDTDRGLLNDMFWILAAIPGVLLLIKRKHRVFFTTFLIATIIAFIFYLSFRASTPYSIKYGVFHYFKMFWPGLILCAVAFFDYLYGYIKQQSSPNLGRRHKSVALEDLANE